MKFHAARPSVPGRRFTRLLGVAGLAAVLTVLTAPLAYGQASVPAVDCNSSIDVYSASEAFLQTCGVISFPLVSKVALPDGGTSSRYVVDGEETWINTPPPGFNAAAADAASRDRYGIPPDPGPADPAGSADWARMVGNLKFVAPPPALRMVPLHFTRNTANWAGQVGTKGGFTSVQVTYTEPNVTNTCSGGAVGFWGGLGGRFTTNLAQNGTSQHAPGLASDQAWYEILPAAPVAVPLFASPGFNFAAFTTRQVATGTFLFFWWNSHTDDSLSLQVASSRFDGSTAELIVERPRLSTGGFTPLAKFGTINGRLTANNVRIGEPNEKDEMYNGAKLLASTSDLDFFNGEYFSVTWKACS
jgi:hypothetical protein